MVNIGDCDISLPQSPYKPIPMVCVSVWGMRWLNTNRNFNGTKWNYINYTVPNMSFSKPVKDYLLHETGIKPC